MKDVKDLLGPSAAGSSVEWRRNLIQILKELEQKYDALLAKLDSDTGVTDVDYEATLKLSE